MKANELMIGDWIKLKDTNSYFKPECIFYNAIRIETTGHHLEDVEIDKFEPIQLTDEILEKNGFTRVGGRSTHESHKFLILHWSKDNLIFNSVAQDGHPIHIPHLQYVHELQHAMRLTGFVEFADNFKL